MVAFLRLLAKQTWGWGLVPGFLLELLPLDGTLLKFAPKHLQQDKEVVGAPGGTGGGGGVEPITHTVGGGGEGGHKHHTQIYIYIYSMFNMSARKNKPNHEYCPGGRIDSSIDDFL